MDSQVNQVEVALTASSTHSVEVVEVPSPGGEEREERNETLPAMIHLRTEIHVLSALPLGLPRLPPPALIPPTLY